MEGDEKIESVLDRAAQLRFKIADVIALGSGKGAETKEREKRLSGIQNALISLEKELASLKALHQQQRYERGEALAKIDHSHKKFLVELEEYKGEDLEVIHDAATIANETDPTIIPELFMLNDKYNSAQFHSNNKLSENDFTVDPTPENSKDRKSQLAYPAHSPEQNKQKVMRSVFAFVVKSAISFVGILSILRLAGFKPEMRERDTSINLLELFPKTACEEKHVLIPGKAPVFEDRKALRLVKERVEIPFGSDFDCHNINFGFG